MKSKLYIQNYDLFVSRVNKSVNNIKFTFFRASGPGGQHRNKVSTACRATDSITGFSSEATNSKSQLKNKQEAWKKLVLKIIDFYQKMDMDEGFARVLGEKRIRTYNEKRNEVVDHRTGVSVPYNEALDGKIQPLIDSVLLKNGLDIKNG